MTVLAFASSAEQVGLLALGLGGLAVVLVVGALVAAFGDRPAEDLQPEPAEDPPVSVTSVHA